MGQNSALNRANLEIAAERVANRQLGIEDPWYIDVVQGEDRLGVALDREAAVDDKDSGRRGA